MVRERAAAAVGREAAAVRVRGAGACWTMTPRRARARER
nr:MAG TPA: hypothetical protein [Caudoviricetes sp.]